MQWTTVASAAFLVVELVQGTNFFFCLLHMLFLMLWIYTFNVAGGFTRASGAYVFWFGLLTIPVATATKAVLGQAADLNAWAPTLTMGIYTVSMAVMLMAVLVTRRITSNVISIAGRLRSYQLDFRNASIGCSALGIAIPFILNIVPSGTGTVFSVIRQVNYFLPIGIILGTLAVVEESNGTRSWGVINGFPAFIGTSIGFATFSKQGMFTAPLCWFIGIAYAHYRLRFLSIVTLGISVLFAFFVLIPIAQVGRDLNASNWGEGLAISLDLLENIGTTRAIYNEAANNLISESSYYGTNIGGLSRFSRFDEDDPLIYYTSQGHYVGYDSVGYAFLNWFPHLILPDKEKYAPADMGGNFYAREMGKISSQDRSTGVSYGSPAEAFHIGGWQSVALIQLLVWVLLFTASDLLCGDLRRAPWGLFLAMAFAHIAPEYGVLSTIQFLWVGNFGLLVCMLFSTYGAPVIGAMLVGSMRRRALEPGLLPAGRASTTAAGQ